jgi:deoxyribodipyrimidine photolyase-related protein
MIKELRLILGDQLNENHSWFQDKNNDIIYVLIESFSELSYVRQNAIKIQIFFKAMRLFAQRLESLGHKVYYLQLDNPENQHSFPANIECISMKFNCSQWSAQHPDEYRLLKELSKIKGLTLVDSEHFLTATNDLGNFFKGKKQFLMESFYRFMRKKFKILMEEDGESPLGGQWNFDKDNRNKLPNDIFIPDRNKFWYEVSDIAEMLKRKKINFLGNTQTANSIDWPLTREDSLILLKEFCQYRLKFFGIYQDSMSDRHDLFFHSMLSFSLNVKLISPKEVIDYSVNYFNEHKEVISISQIEGFVRQILGWREYMRGIYWLKMPDFAITNYFNHQEKLPEWYWTSNTQMKCLSHAIQQSLVTGYAHHIQRLMIIGNFSLLLGVNPDEVDQWYLGIYNDAIEWVEITNTRGMSQYADGGVVATKPYVSSANYIHKMSDYCKSCIYNPQLKYGESSCPFNSLYWDFLNRNRSLLESNPRMGMMYKNWDKKDEQEKESIINYAQYIKENINQA